MPIPSEYATSNPVVREELAKIPIAGGNKVGDFVAPDYPIDAEVVDSVTEAEHKLNLDDLRAPDAEAKEVRFEIGSSGTISVVERALKTKMDTRTIERAGKRGANLVAERLSILRDDILDAKEYRQAQLVTTAANYAAANKDVTGVDFKGGDLIEFVDTWKEAVLTSGHIEPRRALIGKTAWRYARQNAAFREFAGGSDENAGSADLTLEAFAEFLDLDEVRKANYSRVIGNDTDPTQFWPVDSFLLFHAQATLSTRTLAQTAVVPYGPEFDPTDPIVDARTAPLPGTERLTEAGAYHRYRALGRNFGLGFLVTGIVNTP